MLYLEQTFSFDVYCGFSYHKLIARLSMHATAKSLKFHHLHLYEFAGVTILQHYRIGWKISNDRKYNRLFFIYFW